MFKGVLAPPLTGVVEEAKNVQRCSYGNSIIPSVDEINTEIIREPDRAALQCFPYGQCSQGLYSLPGASHTCTSTNGATICTALMLAMEVMVQ